MNRKTLTETGLPRAATMLLTIVLLLLADLTPSVSAAQSSGLSSEQIRETADRVMQQRDFRSVRRRVLENVPDDGTDVSDGFLVRSLGKMGEAIGDFFDWIFSGLFSPPNRRPGPAPQAPPVSTPSPASAPMDISLGKVFLYVCLAVLIMVVMWIIATVIRSRDGRRKMDSRGLFGDDVDITDLSVPPGEFAVSTYESRAIQMAAEGNYGAAIRELLIGSMSWIERAALIRFRKGLTNRDYIRAVWRDELRHVAYGRTAIEFERIYFGRRQATQQMFDDCLQHFQGAFREEEATTAAV